MASNIVNMGTFQAVASEVSRENQHNKVDIRTWTSTSPNLHRGLLQGEMRVERFFTQDQTPTSYNLPVVDSHNLIFSIDNGNAYYRILSLDIRSNAIFTTSRTNNTWNAWRQLVTIAASTATGSTTDPIYINASGEAVAITAGTTGQFYRGDKTWSNTIVGNFVVNGNMSIGASNTENCIEFHGLTGDAADTQWAAHYYIGNRHWANTESSELVLFSGNDIGNGNSATTVSGSGPDRIRFIAGAHLFQTYSSAVSGTFDSVCTSSALVNIFQINTNNVISNKPIILEYNNSWLTPGRVQIGRYDSSNYTDRAVIGVTNGNLHIDAYSTCGLYLNHYASAGNVYFNGSTYYINGGTYNGNSATTTKLATARSINGTNFDGSANITTANWGTARTITIGAAAQDVNGSTNYSWSVWNILGSGFIDTHGEGSNLRLLDGGNELYAFYDRGGTCTAYEVASSVTNFTGSLTKRGDLAQIPAAVFCGSGGYPGGSYSGDHWAVYDLKLPSGASYTQYFFWSFGNGSWKPEKMRVLASNNGTSYTEFYSSDNCPAYGQCGIGFGATGTYYIRIVVSKYSRLCCFGWTHYAYAGLRTTYMNRCINDAVYRSISPAINNKYDLGGSSNKWANVYATTFNGALSGNASTASKILDSNNSTAITASYNAGGVSTFSWATVWNGYHLTYISKADLMSQIRGAASGSWGINITGSSASCTGNAATATKATQDGNGNTITSTYLPKREGGAVGGCSGNGSYSYCKLVTITANNSYMNNPISFTVSGRGIPTSLVTIIFQNYSGTNPGVSFFTSSDYANIWIHQDSTSVWGVYIQYTEAWGSVYIHRITGNGNGYITTINLSNVSSVPSGSTQVTVRYWRRGDAVTGAVWNDYAEFREAPVDVGYGRVVREKGDDSLILTTDRLQDFAGITSDTWGFAQGETSKAKIPIAVAGRVLTYPYRNRDNYLPGDCVCSAPNGTVDIMTRDEIISYPDKIVGTVSYVPDYEEWGEETEIRKKVKVDGRIWIKVR